MKLCRTSVLALLVVVPMIRISTVKAGDASDGQRWWSHVAVLADDKLEGRNTGSAGHRKAAEYVAAAVRQLPDSSRPAPTDIFSPCT